MTRTSGGVARWALAFLAALAICPPARADQRTDARRHFKAGMDSVARGEFDRGIGELKRAYEIKPHPNVLFNIAKAYQDNGQSQLALDWYRRYLETDPPDRERVEGIVARLKESLVPPRPLPAAAPDKPPVARTELPPTGPRDDKRLAEREKRLDALLDRLEKAVAKAEVPPAPGPIPDASPEPLPAGPHPAPAAFGDEMAEVYEEVVVTASRRAQTSLEAPNAVTVITDEDIHLSGASSIPDLLRRVPGIDVMELGFGSADVSVRGFNQRIANKVLVLVDGRSVYQDFLGATLWPQIPLALEEVKRIEVVRGPGSTLYGANAFLGVVNIITKSPSELAGFELNAGAGTGSWTRGGWMGAGRSGKLGYRTALGFERADKWSVDFAAGRKDVLPRVDDPNLGLRVGRADAELTYDLGDQKRALLAGGYSNIYGEIYPLGLLRNFYLDGQSYFSRAEAPVGPLKLKAFYDHLDGNAGPQYWPAGTRPLDATFRTNVADAELQYDQGFHLAGEHQLTAGLGYRYKDVAWNYLSAFKAENHFSGYVQEEYRPMASVRVIAGYRFDRHPLLDGGQPGFAQSPRFGAVWLPVANQAIRVAAASSFRVPTFLESYINVVTPVQGQNGVAVLTQGNTALKPERLVAGELGWRAELDRVDLDVAIYDQRVNDLVVISAVRPSGIAGSWDPRTGTYLLGQSSFVNDPTTYNAIGAEAGAKWTPVDRLDIRGTVAVERITVADGATTAGDCVPCNSAPGLKLYGGLTYRSRLGVDLDVSTAWTSSTLWIEREPDPVNPSAIAFVPNSLGSYLTANARIGWRAIPDRLELGLVGSHLEPTHREHPFGNDIQRRVLFTLWARF